MKITNQTRKIMVDKWLIAIKIIFVILLFNLTISLETESNAATYGKDYFGKEYSNGYIRNCTSSDVIRTYGASKKTCRQIYSASDSCRANNLCYTSNNTSKSVYIDYSKGARTIDSNGVPIWLDMRIYVWTNNKNYSWALNTGWLGFENAYKSVTQHTTMEFHFYTTGHCGDSNYEQSFKGVICFSDLDTYEGWAIHSGYNQVYLQSGIPITYVAKGSKNSTNGNNPFTRSGTSSYTYFFGTRMNGGTDNVWVEINSTPSSPFTATYGTRADRGSAANYQGTTIEYYVDGVLKDRFYCVPYGRYTLVDTSKFESQKIGYAIDGWYTDQSYSTRAYDGIAGTSTIRVYGKYILYTITVDNEKSGHTYNSYQVFQGDYYEKENEEGNKIPTLSNIEWSSELQKEIVTENEEMQGQTHGEKIIELLKEKNTDLYKDCETAEDVAKLLQGKPNDGDIIREFTDVVGKYILENNIEITKGTSELLEEKDRNGNVVLNYKIKDLEPGYYIVIDAKANEKDDAYSRYLIDVVQDVTMEPKSSIPKLNKKVIGNNIKNQIEGTGTSEENSVQYILDEKRNTATYKEVSEIYNAEDYDIEFELKSYIPNPDGYNTYKFEIVDILAKGFDFDRNSIKVMLGENEYPKTREKEINSDNSTKDEIENGDTNEFKIVENYTIRDIVINVENYETYKAYFEEEGKEYLEGYAESQYGKTLILVEFDDLVEQLEDGIVEKGQDVIVTYNAKLNEKREVGNTPNINEAYLIYSNNPYKTDEITQTTTQPTYTYTIDLNLSKIAELKSETDEKIYLSGAEFEIYDGPEYIKEDGSLLQIRNPNRKLLATITTDEIVDSEGNIIKEPGKAIYSSLGAGTYYLKETKSPEGYNKLREEIEIEVKAECDKYGIITWLVENKTNNNLILAQIEEKEGTTIPEIKLQVENTSGFQLPVTGGRGNAIFTLVGLSIMLGAIVTLKLIKKQN